MKMKQVQKAAFIFMLTASLVACKKSTNDNQLDFGKESVDHSEDQNFVSIESDNMANDVNNIVDSYVSFAGRTDGTQSIPCDATVVVDSTASLRRITLTYNGDTCVPFRTRSGVVVITMPLGTRWRNMGAVLTVNYQNLKITRRRDNRFVTLNGTKTITNVSGGLIRNLPAINSVTHTVASNNMRLTFSDSTQRTWSIAKQRVFTFNNGLVITTTGTGTVDGINNASEWGTNRYGNNFITSITQPLVFRQDCLFRLTAGQVTHQRMAANIVVTFGLDANGNATSCPGLLAPYYLKMVYNGANGNTVTVIRPY